jgi:oligogalacturonide lyase
MEIGPSGGGSLLSAINGDYAMQTALQPGWQRWLSGAEPAWRRWFFFWCWLMLVHAMPASTAVAESAPNDWIDRATGHRVIRLTDVPGTASLYYHQNPFTPPGDKMVVFSRNGLSVMDIKTRQLTMLYSWHNSSDRVTGAVVAPRSRRVFFLAGDGAYAIDLDTRRTKRISTLPRTRVQQSSLTVNANETFLVGNYTENLEQLQAEIPRQRWLAEIPERHPSSTLFSIAINTGKMQIFYKGNYWFDHPQFSPTDPELLNFIYQGSPVGPGDNTWIIRLDGSGLHRMLDRREHGEAAIHPFWDPSGHRLWYDLQIPWGRRFYLGSTEVPSFSEQRYPLAPENWSIHYNISKDGLLFAGDGNPQFPGGKWIWLFRLTNGRVTAEHLVDLSKQDYKLEPNVHFTPDGKWVIFRSNMEGANYPYAVEVNRSQ